MGKVLEWWAVLGLAYMVACTLMFSIIYITSISDGTFSAILTFNDYHEAWIEIPLFHTGAVGMFIFLWQYFHRKRRLWTSTKQPKKDTPISDGTNNNNNKRYIGMEYIHTYPLKQEKKSSTGNEGQGVYK